MSQTAYVSGSAFPELKPGTLRLYSSRICPYAQRARLVLAHKNIPHEVVNVELRDKPEWFLEVAPLGKVPVLQHDDVNLYESTAVAEYLDDVYPGDRLQEDDPYKKARDRILLESFGQFTSAYYGIVMSAKNAPVDLDSKADQLLKQFQVYEDELGKRGTQFFGGSRPKMIDFFLWPHFERVPAFTKMTAKIELSEPRFPKLTRWWGVMTQVPAVKKEMFDADWHVKIFQRMMEGKPFGNLELEE